MKNIKLKETYLLFLIVIGLISLSVYSTYALFTASTEIEDVVNFTATLTTKNNVIEYEMITIPAGETKKVELNISNSYSDILYYGAWYEMISPSKIDEDIKIGLYNSSMPGSGTIPAEEQSTITIAITNSSNSNIIINIGIASSITEELKLSDNRTLIREQWSGIGVLTAAEFLMDNQNIKGYEWDEDITNYGLYATNSYVAEDGTTKYHDYRYVGAEPDNYVWFNNDMYRIIGIFDDSSHGVTGQYLVKLISANNLTTNSIGVYNSSKNSGTLSGNNNAWTETETTGEGNVNVLLNHFFLEDTTNDYGNCSGWTYYRAVNASKTYNCSNILGYQIKKNNGMQDYIENTTWHLKGYNSNAYSKQNFYLCERGQIEDTTICNVSGTTGTNASSVQAKIGLMYASDYLYASGNYSSTDNTTKASGSYYAKNNWLYRGAEWTITPQTNSNVKFFSIGGSLSTQSAHVPYQVRQVFYLKSNVKISDGNGSFEKPYILSL